MVPECTEDPARGKLKDVWVIDIVGIRWALSHDAPRLPRLASVQASDGCDDVVTAAEGSVDTENATIGELIGTRVGACTEDYRTARQLWHSSAACA